MNQDAIIPCASTRLRRTLVPELVQLDRPLVKTAEARP